MRNGDDLSLVPLHIYFVDSSKEDKKDHGK